MVRSQCFGEGAAADDERVKPVGQFIVGNSDFEDKRSSLLTQELGSNFGKVKYIWHPPFVSLLTGSQCVTIWAPGTSLNVASGKDDTVRVKWIPRPFDSQSCFPSLQTIEHGGFGFSGTSFSAPLLAGTIAAYGKLTADSLAGV
jgi:subtilisin family serine protease